jgi:hypothetical protein
MLNQYVDFDKTFLYEKDVAGASFVPGATWVSAADDGTCVFSGFPIGSYVGTEASKFATVDDAVAGSDQVMLAPAAVDLKAGLWYSFAFDRSFDSSNVAALAEATSQTELWSTVFSPGEYHDAASGVRVLPMSKTRSCGCCAFNAALIGGEGFQCPDDYNSLPDNIKSGLPEQVYDTCNEGSLSCGACGGEWQPESAAGGGNNASTAECEANLDLYVAMNNSFTPPGLRIKFAEGATATLSLQCGGSDGSGGSDGGAGGDTGTDGTATTFSVAADGSNNAFSPVGVTAFAWFNQQQVRLSRLPCCLHFSPCT